MSLFSRKLWRNRQTEYPNRRKITSVSSGETFSYDVERDEGLVFDEGDRFNDENMNDLEERISDGFAGAGDRLGEMERLLDEGIAGLTAALDEKTGEMASIRKTATITASGWTTSANYASKTTGLTLPDGADADVIDLYIPHTSLVNLDSWVAVGNVGGTVHIYAGDVPNGSLSITLTFKRTRSA